MEEHYIDEKALNDYVHGLWFRVLREAPQGHVLELCRQANLNASEIQHIAQFRTILAHQHRELEELREAAQISESVLSSPVVESANAIVAQRSDKGSPSIMRRLGRFVGKLKS